MNLLRAISEQLATPQVLAEDSVSREPVSPCSILNLLRAISEQLAAPQVLAEREGFEPPIALRLCLISRLS